MKRPEQTAGNGTGHFFAIDRRAWAFICRLGINPAVAYLVLARGTGADQRTTAWSVNAIEAHTGIARPRAQKAIETLVQAGLAQITQTGTRPRYRLRPAHEVSGCEGYPPATLDHTEQRLLDQITRGDGYVPAKASKGWYDYRRSPRDVATELVRKGWARPYENCAPGNYLAIAYDAEAAAKPDWIWLPNAIIDGIGNEIAPVELVRQTQNIATLRLLIDLYHAQALDADGGIHWRSIRQGFTRFTVGQRGSFIVYGFQPGTPKAWMNKSFVRPHMTGELEAIEGTDEKRDRGEPIFWKAWGQLMNLGLVDLVGHLVEADNDTADIIHPYARDNGELAERRIAAAAHDAGRAMLTEEQRDRAEANGLHLVPVRAHITEVQMVGIARLRYRPRTSATAAWFASMVKWDEWAIRYDEMTAAIMPATMQHQGTSR
jgi:hypothetical protein